MLLDDIDGAIREYEEALRVSPDQPTAHYNLAVALEAKGQLARAIEEYKLYLQLAPNASDAEQVRAHLRKLHAAL